MYRVLAITAALMLVVAWCSGCDGEAPASAPVESAAQTGVEAPVASAPVAEPPVLDPASASWSQKEAVAKLVAGEQTLSAAVRLVRLAEIALDAVPDPLPNDLARLLDVRPLDEGRWVLGVRDAKRADVLWSGAMIGADGGVQTLAEDGGAAVAVRVSADADVFPHMVIARDRVRFPDALDETALLLLHPESVGFAVRELDGFPYLALVPWEDPDGAELARYRWDPYELMFLGPARDNIAAEHGGGEFELDLHESVALEPVGGKIPEPPAAPPPDQQPPIDWGGDALPV